MSEQSRLKGASILIVEDEPAVSSLLHEAIGDTGATMLGPAADIDAALWIIRNQQVDAAILDLIVHGAFCDEIAEELYQRKIPFAVTTGIGVGEGHPSLDQAVTITKPFQQEYVREVLEDLLAAPRPA